MEQTKTCVYCGREIKESEARRNAYGAYCCAECWDERFELCQNCGEVVLRGGLRRVHIHGDDGERVELWCWDCRHSLAAQCDECLEWHAGEIDYGFFTGAPLRGRRRNGTEQHICARCMRDYDCCDDCGRLVWRNELREIGGRRACAECAGESFLSPSEELLHDWHTLPTIADDGERLAFPFFGKKDPRAREWFGIGPEVEVDRSYRDEDEQDACLSELHDMLGNRAVFERDGSLSNGFEIIIAPHTVKEFWRLPWGEIFGVCKRHGYAADDIGTCGLHLHISRAFFGATEEARNRALSKLVMFYDCFFPEILRVSRRTEGRANMYAARHYATTPKRAKRVDKHGGSRYHAVNLTNEATVEVRIMRGTLDEATFRACVDFIITTAKNSRRIAWRDCGNAQKWLAGISRETADYIRARGAFLDALDALNI